jgi:hypothetical protein
VSLAKAFSEGPVKKKVGPSIPEFRSVKFSMGIPGS